MLIMINDNDVISDADYVDKDVDFDAEANADVNHINRDDTCEDALQSA